MFANIYNRHSTEIEKLEEYKYNNIIYDYEYKNGNDIDELNIIYFNDLYNLLIPYKILVPKRYIYDKVIIYNNKNYHFILSDMLIEYVCKYIIKKNIDYLDELLSYDLSTFEFVIIDINNFEIYTNNKKYLLHIDNNYKDLNYYFKLNNILFKYDSSISLIDNILKYIKKDKFNILIYCHPYCIEDIKLNNSPEKYVHYDIDNIRKYVYDFLDKSKIDNKSNIIVDTIDIRTGGSIVYDGFSEEFYEFFEDHFDMVFLPDCGGKWFEYQKRFTDENLQSLIDIIESSKRILTENGEIIFGKIINEQIMEIFKSKYKYDIDGFNIYFIEHK
jgi:hypothetical protein